MKSKEIYKKIPIAISTIAIRYMEIMVIVIKVYGVCLVIAIRLLSV